MKHFRPAVPDAVEWIVRKLEDAGHETWAVGGAVRDSLAGRASGDWDLTTHARPGEVQKIFRRTVPLGIEHGTVGVLARDGTMYEVTTFRRDVETDGRHAVIAFADTVREDLARRDFTINAIAYHPLRQEVLDPYGGQSDLEAGVLRTVGSPTERFAEDYLRVLRAFRFAGRFGLSVHAETWQAAQAVSEQLRDLSSERVREELLKVLDMDPRPSMALKLYSASGAIAALYPELESLRVDRVSAWEATLASLDALPVGRPHLRLAALLRDVDAQAGIQLLSRLRLSNSQTEEAALLASAEPLPPPDVDGYQVRRWLAAAGPERLTAIARLDLARAKALGPSACATVVDAWRRAKAERRSGVPLSVGELAINGRTLIHRGMKPGPEFGRILGELLQRVLERPELNTVDELTRLVDDLNGREER